VLGVDITVIFSPWVLAEARMANEYKVYQLSRDHPIATPPTAIVAQDDNEALQQAEQLLDGKDTEIWQS
jgi:hypothetical protein